MIDPLALDEHDVGVARRAEHEILRGSRDEVRDHGVDRCSPAFDEDARLARPHERGANSPRP